MDINFEELDKILELGTKEELADFIVNNDLTIKDGKIVPNEINVVKDLIEYWDKQQHVKKILLNSLYGAILNKHCRYFDHRIGQSTTLTGRGIVKNMTEVVNESLTGERDYIGKSITYNDTDSVYFSAWPMIEESVKSGEQEWDIEMAITLYDSLGEIANDQFPDFMLEAYHCPQRNGEIIKCGREVVGSSGLFITKKRYAIMVIDDEGKRYDKDGKPGKIKAMGLDLKRSDTPKFVQEFLKDILSTVLTTVDKGTVIDQVLSFKSEFNALPGWEKGTPKKINKLSKYTAEEKWSMQEYNKPARLPGHVRAGMNYMALRDINNDNITMDLKDGSKAIVCKLKKNDYGWKSIARPIDEANIPDWFKDLPFDHAGMEEALVDKKVDNLLGILKWDLDVHTDTSSTFTNLFDF